MFVANAAHVIPIITANSAFNPMSRDYALAKECVTQEAKSGCAIGQYINRDLFNPFCTYNMDPPLDTSSTVTIYTILQFIKRFSLTRLEDYYG